MSRVGAAHTALGQAVRERRLELVLRQAELAAAAGMHRSYLGGVEVGRRNVGYTNIIRIAKALGIKASELVERSERGPATGLGQPPRTASRRDA